jgi:hypothetical protein
MTVHGLMTIRPSSTVCRASVWLTCVPSKYVAPSGKVPAYARDFAPRMLSGAQGILIIVDSYEKYFLDPRNCS